MHVELKGDDVCALQEKVPRLLHREDIKRILTGSTSNESEGAASHESVSCWHDGKMGWGEKEARADCWSVGFPPRYSCSFRWSSVHSLGTSTITSMHKHPQTLFGGKTRNLPSKPIVDASAKRSDTVLRRETGLTLIASFPSRSIKLAYCTPGVSHTPDKAGERRGWSWGLVFLIFTPSTDQ